MYSAKHKRSWRLRVELHAATDAKTAVLQIYVCRSGSAADTQNMSAYVQYYLRQHCVTSGRDAEVKTAAMLAKQLVYSNKVAHGHMQHITTSNWASFSLREPTTWSCGYNPANWCDVDLLEC